MEIKNPLELLDLGLMTLRLKLAKPFIAKYRAETGDCDSDELHAYCKALIKTYREKHNDYFTKDYAVLYKCLGHFRITP